MHEHELPDLRYSQTRYEESFNPDFTPLVCTNHDLEPYNLDDLNSQSLQGAIGHASPRYTRRSTSNVLEREPLNIWCLQTQCEESLDAVLTALVCSDHDNTEFYELP